MHAYHPDDADQLGILIAPRAVTKPSGTPLEMVEIAPMCRSLMGLAGMARPASGIDRPAPPP